MRSLFHFPFPAQPPSQQPSHCSQKCAIARILHPCAASAAPQFCFPPPARSPVPRLPDPGPLSPAPRAPAMPRRRPCLAPLPAPIAPHHLSTAPLPPAPIGLASSASRPPHAVARIASTPLRAAIRIPLCRHRADPALIAPHHDHRAPPSYTCCASPSASRPPCAAARVTPISLLALRRPQGPGWQEPRRMHPFFAECAKKAPFLATSARNACFSRSRWQHPRPMHPFPGAIGRFRMHGARILPPRALFRVEEPEITHGAKMLPAPPGLSAAAACDTRHGRTGFAPCGSGMRHAAWPNGLCALRRGPGLLAACAPPCHLACARRGLRPLPSRPRSSPPSYTRRASPSETRHAVPVPMYLATCAPHPSRQPRGPTASRKQAEQRKQLNAGIKIGSPNGDPIE